MFVGLDWAETHHDVAVMAEDGRVLATRRVPRGWPGCGCCTSYWPPRLRTRSGARDPDGLATTGSQYAPSS
jgi:hypothetical protein